MASGKNKVYYVCSQCGERYVKWQGQCSQCKSWNSLEEKNLNVIEKSSARSQSAISASALARYSTGISEFDRLLGGGIVAGSVVLLGGEPGVGKSTLLLELVQSGRKILYVSAEESLEQVQDRAFRVGALKENLYLLQENHVATILATLEKEKPELVLVDSIQALWQEGGRGFSGSIAQLRESAQLLIEFAKKTGIPVILTGHITKDGQLAGPKLLEHAVDVVLYFEPIGSGRERVVRATKNRFGHTGEIALFEMTERGLLPIGEGHFLAQIEQIGGVGSILFPQKEGQRILPLEVQVLVTPTGLANGRRIGENIEIARIHLIAAILEKYVKYRLSQCDIFVRVRGGASLHEPAGDLALLLAMASSYLEKALPKKLAAAGEISLTGHIRAPSYPEERLLSLTRLGIEKAYWGEYPTHTHSLEILSFSEVTELIKNVFS